MATMIDDYTSQAVRAITRMADRIQWDPIDKVERLELIALIASLCAAHEAGRASEVPSEPAD